MLVIVLATGLVLLGIAGVYRHTLSKRAVRHRLSDQPVDLFAEVSTEKYLPMFNLLDDAEYHYLASQPGFTPDIGRRFRADRMRLFRAYLRALGKDFDRMYLAATTVVMYSSEDRSDLTRALFRHRFVFRCAMLRVHARLLFYRLGFGTVPIADLIGSLRVLQIQVRHLVADAATV